jgi:hypothetical protein
MTAAAVEIAWVYLRQKNGRVTKVPTSCGIDSSQTKVADPSGVAIPCRGCNGVNDYLRTVRSERAAEPIATRVSGRIQWPAAQLECVPYVLSQQIKS